MSDQKVTGITVKKDENFSEWYTQVVLKSGLVDYAPIKGFIVLKPYGYAIWENIRNIFDRYFKETDHQNAFLPTLIPENLLSKEKNHFTGFNPEVFWVTQAGENNLAERLALRPTSETLAYSIFSNWISSYRDLPLKINFWNTALRAEIKATKPFIRTSEFLWQEGHTMHENEEEAKEEVKTILDIYHDGIRKHLAIPTVKGYKSDKEKFVGAIYTTTVEALMSDGKCLQMGTSHNLGQNFSIPFDIKYLGKDTREHFVWQTSWGISWRLIGAIIMVHGDDKGLILPPDIAPIQAVIIPIYKGDNTKSKVNDYARKIAAILKEDGLRVHIDDRDEYTAGWKYNDWELKGVPLRLSAGPRDIERGDVEVVCRHNKEKLFVSLSELTLKIPEVLDKVQNDLLSQAESFLNRNTRTVKNYSEFTSTLDTSGGFIRAGWCQREECENKIKDETGADIRVLPFDSRHESQSQSILCIYCNKEAQKIALFGRAY